MPDPTKNQQNTDQKPVTDNSQTAPDFLSADSSNTPPMMASANPPTNTDQPVVNTQQPQTVTDKPEEVKTDELPPVISSTPKKKFGGRIIATILGFLVLAGGIAGGVILTQQNQNIAEKAGACAENPCPAGYRCDGKGDCVPRDTTDEQVDSGEVDSITPEEARGQVKDEDGNVSCAVQCGGPGLAFNFCLPPGSTKTCNQEAEARGYVVPIGSVSCVKNSSGEWIPDTSNTTNVTSDGLGQWLAQCRSQCPANSNTCNFGSGAYICPPGHSGPCTEANGRPYTGNLSCFCGVIQVDTGSGHTSYRSNCGCDNEETVTPTAACQNVKAYNSSFTQLTAQQLSALTVGNVVNFCVAGTTTQGTFDKARFTINGAVQAETTTKRPGSNDFCQSYTIPAGVTTFNVSAQIHHPTLGYK